MVAFMITEIIKDFKEHLSWDLIHRTELTGQFNFQLRFSTISLAFFNAQLYSLNNRYFLSQVLKSV